MTACDDFEYDSFPFLSQGLDLAEEYKVDARKIRYQLFGQRSEREFLGKLWCIRKAESSWLSDPQARDWLRFVNLKIFDILPYKYCSETLMNFYWYKS